MRDLRTEQIIEDKERCAAAVEAMSAIVELDKATASDKEERNRQMLARGVEVGFLKRVVYDHPGE